MHTNDLPIPERIDVVPLVDSVLFPSMAIPLEVQSISDETKKRLEEHPFLIVTPRLEHEVYSNTGVMAHITHIRQNTKKQKDTHAIEYILDLDLLFRVDVMRYEHTEKGIFAEWEKKPAITTSKIDDLEEWEHLLEILGRLFHDVCETIMKELETENDARRFRELLSKTMPEESDDEQNPIAGTHAIIDRVTGILQQIDKNWDIFLPCVAILQEDDVTERLKLLIALLSRMQTKTEERAEEGDFDEESLAESMYNQYQERYDTIKDTLSADSDARREIERELGRLLHSESSQDSSMICDHLDVLLDLFSLKETEDNTDLPLAKRILDEDHFGLKVPKERVLEHLAVRKRAAGTTNILCIVGPPGTGKTSLGRSIARALGRNVVRLSLGGLRDEAEIRGHRLTYIRSQPGRIIERIIKSGSNNPVFIFDEVDKIGEDWRGDPASALLEVLDPEQNKEFTDTNVNVLFDLSQVFFICTANTTTTIPDTLLDRMEVIKLSGYTVYEKLAIAKKYLIPKARTKTGIPIADTHCPLDVLVSDNAVTKLIEEYTDEAGVRQLERVINGIFRRIVRGYEMEEYKNVGEIKITTKNLSEYAGKSVIYPEQRFENLPVGCVPMFAVSETGGYFFYVEILIDRYREERKVKVTGVRGSDIPRDITNLIEESVDVALDSLVLEDGVLYRAPKKASLRKKDFYIHVHVGDSATPKDGPSAGIPMLWALYSCLTKQPIQPKLGATGEVNLRLGPIGAVGGIREKAIAAHRAGITRFIIPEYNRQDLDEVPNEVKERVEFLPKRFWWEALLEAFPNDRRLQQFVAKKQSS